MIPEIMVSAVALESKKCRHQNGMQITAQVQVWAPFFRDFKEHLWQKIQLWVEGIGKDIFQNFFERKYSTNNS